MQGSSGPFGGYLGPLKSPTYTLCQNDGPKLMSRCHYGPIGSGRWTTAYHSADNPAYNFGNLHRAT